MTNLIPCLTKQTTDGTVGSLCKAVSFGKKYDQIQNFIAILNSYILSLHLDTIKRRLLLVIFSSWKRRIYYTASSE